MALCETQIIAPSDTLSYPSTTSFLNSPDERDHHCDRDENEGDNVAAR